MKTKDIVLEKLYSNPGTAVSGEELASCCGVSRAAIWKAVNTLREEGCSIEGTTNGGYVLNGEPDIFSKQKVFNFLSKKFPQFSHIQIECFKEIDSTNTYAKRILAESDNLRTQDQSLTPAGKKLHQSLIISESQTAGRGRLGRTFVSPSKTGIYITIIYAPQRGITNPARITALSGVAVCRAIKKLYNKEPSIKWINDIFINGKKVCGILTEGTTNFETGTIEAAVIGIGINITSNTEAFGTELSKIAGSISEENSTNNISRAELAAQIAGETLSVLEEPVSQAMEEYKNYSFLAGKTVTVHPVIGDSQKDYAAKIIDITDEAALVVQLADGTTKTLISGEVSLGSDTFAN